jgi:hypothetical protein
LIDHLDSIFVMQISLPDLRGILLETVLDRVALKSPDEV